MKTCFGAGNLYKDLFSFYLQPSANKNSENLAFLTFQSDDVTVKTIKKGNGLPYYRELTLHEINANR